MAVYGNEVLQEGSIFGSEEGKKFKKELKEEFEQQLKEKISIKRGLATGGIDYKKAKKAVDIIKNKCKNIFASNIYQIIYGNGTTEYCQEICGITDFGYVHITLSHHYRLPFIRKFSECLFSDCIIPKDVIEKAISSCDTKFDLYIGKNYIYSAKVTSNIQSYNKDLFKEIEDYVEKKYKDQFTLKVAKMTSRIIFKKK